MSNLSSAQGFSQKYLEADHWNQQTRCNFPWTKALVEKDDSQFLANTSFVLEFHKTFVREFFYPHKYTNE